MAKALSNGVTLTFEEIEIVRNEIQRLRDENARLGVREPRYRAILAQQTEDMRERLRPHKPPSRAARAILVGWAMLWLGIDTFYRRMAAINRSAT